MKNLYVIPQQNLVGSITYKLNHKKILEAKTSISLLMKNSHKLEPKPETICTGCGALGSKNLGKNHLGNDFLSCCPDSNYISKQEITDDLKDILAHITKMNDKHQEQETLKENINYEKQ